MRPLVLPWKPVYLGFALAVCEDLSAHSQVAVSDLCSHVHDPPGATETHQSVNSLLKTYNQSIACPKSHTAS